MNYELISSKLNEKFSTNQNQLNTSTAGDPYFLINKEQLLPICQYLKENEELWFNFLKLITAVDQGDKFSSVYHLYSYKYEFGITLKVDLEKTNPVVDSLCGLYKAANWLERECYDLMGIIYKGHPDLRRILLPLDWQGYPLRKDYVAPTEYNGIDNT
ncbi:MAG: NADH-quinone oxidoreductase subunit C [Deltaproteobacteria bacterium]|jgi:NADH-quinone oxidoreductase subunit C|nr:NADH-quinone oxidoreductase subunit C [Deltaproteobacteria bacterium]